MVGELSMVEKVASSQYVWAILFILLAIGALRFLQWYIKNVKADSERRETALIELYEQQRADSHGRENKLMNHLERTTASLEGIEKNLSGLELKLNQGLNDIWEHLDKRK